MWKRVVPILALGPLALLAYAGNSSRSQEPGAAPAAGAEGAAPAKVANSRITHVTVYQNTALVTREVDIPEGTGTLEVTVTPLPPQTVNSSLYSEGTDGIRVLTTRYRTRPVKEDTREEVRKLEAQLKELQLAAQKLQSDGATLQQNMQMLTKLEGFTAVATTTGTEKGTLSGETVITLSKYIMENRAEKAKQMVQQQQELQANQEQSQFVQRQLRDLTAGSTKTERDAIIVVDKKNAAPGKIRLNYLVDSSSWRPQYKLRASKDEKEPVQVEYLAAVTQQSGEDWSNVTLILSTAQPMLNAAPPDLKMLEVVVVPRAGVPVAAGRPGANMVPGTQAPMAPGQPGGGFPGGFGGGGMGGPGMMPPSNMVMSQTAQGKVYLQEQARGLRGQAQQEFNRKNNEVASLGINNAAAIEQTIDLFAAGDDAEKKGKWTPPPAPSSREGQSVTYHLNARLSVPSRNDEQVIEVAKLEMAPDYFYKAVPVLTPHIYRLANLTNKSQYVLLPGEATAYLGNDFVGRMDLPLVAIGEQFTAGFGVDPQLQVFRQMTDKSRELKGGNQVQRFEYRILVNSYKPESVKLQLWDRLPHAENEQAGVSLVKAAPEVSADALYQREQRPQNLLRWDLKLDPTMNGEKALAVNYEFRLELDRQMTIGNFSIK